MPCNIIEILSFVYDHKSHAQPNYDLVQWVEMCNSNNSNSNNIFKGSLSQHYNKIAIEGTEKIKSH